MTEHFTRIGDQVVPTPEVVPERKFRPAWALDAANAIVLDQAKADAITAEVEREEALSSDPDRTDLVGRLATATPDQIKSYVQNNVTDLASAKALLTKIVLVLSLMARE